MITIEQILEAVKQQPQLAVQILENVPTLPGGSDYIKKANEAYFSENITGEVSRIYNGIDDDIFELTGKRKKADQKTYDWVKEVLGEFKKLAEDGSAKTPQEVKDLKDKIKDLEEKVKNGESSAHWKTSYEELVEELRKNKEDHKKEIDDLNSQILGNNVESDVAAGLVNLKLNEALPENVRNAYINQHKADLIKNAKIIDGKVVYHDGEGKPLRDKQYNPASAEYLLKERLKDILAAEKTPGGGATTGEKGEVITTGTGDNATRKIVLDRETFSTRQQFLSVAEKALAEAGVTRNDADYNTLLDEAHKEYDVSKLPRN